MNNEIRCQKCGGTLNSGFRCNSCGADNQPASDNTARDKPTRSPYDLNGLKEYPGE